uniref:hypothetical protein n=2 Tax=Algoriphagus sp. TaxID=1872435 RepID=UPI004047C141
MKKEVYVDSCRKANADFSIKSLIEAPIDQRFFSVWIRVKKEVYADSRRKGNADFSIKSLNESPIDQREKRSSRRFLKDKGTLICVSCPLESA